jgi:hypothetical protein
MVVALLVRIHRYLGIATGPSMVMWCLSGAVMMYVPYPRLAEQQRLRALPPISWSGCCAFGTNGAMGGAASGDFGIEMRAGRLVLRGLNGRSFDLAGGTPADGVGVTEAALTADSFAGPTRFLGILVHPVHDRSPSVRRRTGWCRTHGMRGAAGLRRSHHAWRPASFVASTHRDLRLGAA